MFSHVPLNMWPRLWMDPGQRLRLRAVILKKPRGRNFVAGVMINFRSQFHCNPSSKGALCRKVKERNKNCYDLIENNVHPHRPWEMCFFFKDPVLDLVWWQQSHLFTHTPILWTNNSVSYRFVGNFYTYQSGEASSNFGAQLLRRSQLPKPFITAV